MDTLPQLSMDSYHATGFSSINVSATPISYRQDRKNAFQFSQKGIPFQFKAAGLNSYR